MSVIKRLQERSWLAVLLATLPLLVFVLLVTRNAIDLPILDDYNAVLGFTETFAGLHGWAAKTALVVTSQHNEYKLIFQHAIYALEFESTGHLNFAFLQQLGNLFIPLTAVCLWFLFPEGLYTRAQRIWLFLPVSLLLFAPTYQEALDFAMQGLQNIAVVPFALATIILLHRNRFPLASIALVLCIATSGNGFFVSIAGALLLVQQRKRRRLLLWIAITLASAAIYAVQYKLVRVIEPIPLSESARNLVLFPLILLGSLGGRVVPAVIIGMGFTAGFLLLVRAGWRRANPPAFYCAVFILITSLAVDSTRHTFGLDAAVASRYRLYSLIFLALLYCGVVQRLLAWPWLLRLQAWAVFTAICLLFCIRSDRMADRVLSHRNRLLIQHAERWLADSQTSVIPDEDPLFQTPAWRVTRREANQTLRRAIESGIYVPPYPPRPASAQTPSPAGPELDSRP